MNSWLLAPNIKTTHGFSNRIGGVSNGNFSSLNLGGHDDDKQHILANRVLALEQLNIKNKAVRILHQVHGNEVVDAVSDIDTGDALVCNERGLPIAIGVADCYPILFHDADNHVIGAAHAGWRGTVSRIAQKTIEMMLEKGAQLKNIQVAIGQGISCERFEVGPEVIDEFLSKGFYKSCIKENHIDLIDANKQVLLNSGIEPANIWSMNRCTFESDFFSYRRDNGKTGRMWGLIMLD